MNCPRCKSENVKVVKHLTIKCIICNDCGYDERDQYDVYPENKTKHYKDPYKAGGPRRTS